MRNLLYILVFLTSFAKAQHAPFNPHPKEEVSFYSQVVVNSGSLTPTERMAASCYVSDLLNNGLFNKSYAVYPMTGKTINSCKVNLIAPSNYSITFVNTVAGDFTSAGFKPNGTNKYGKTGLIPSTTMTLSTTGLHYFSSSTQVAGAFVEMSSVQSSSARMTGQIRTAADQATGTAYNATAGQGLIAVTNTVTVGMFSFVRASATDNQIYMNGSSIITTTTTGGSLPNLEIYISAQNNAGAAASFSSKQCNMAAITYGLNSTEVLNFYNATLRHNTFLGR